jgi:hypothetical protein
LSVDSNKAFAFGETERDELGLLTYRSTKLCTRIFFSVRCHPTSDKECGAG